ncbi:MAG: hypothetical protein KGI25_04665 [Thaumarchaeota archaeon]|nr:hypothetical protein [Nitrososphaerota archaeon]
MNIQALKTNQKLLAMILGVAIIATVGGSLAYAQTAPGSGSGTGQTHIQGSVNVPQMILSSVKVPFTTAATTAAGGIPNGKVLGGGLVIQQGYAVYAFKVTNGTSVYSVIVDAGNGSVLKTSQGHPLTMGAFGGMGGPGIRMHGHFGMHAGSWSKSTTPGSTTPSTTTPSGFQE